MGEVNLAGLLDVAKHPEFSEGELNNLYRLFCRHAVEKKPVIPCDKVAAPASGTERSRSPLPSSCSGSLKGTIPLDNFKMLLEALQLPQTHLQAKETYEKYAKDGSIHLEDYMRLVKDLTLKNGTLSVESVMQLASSEEVNVDDVGVGGAKRFFEAKAKVLDMGDASYRAFEDKKKEAEDMAKRRDEFKQKREQFQPSAPS